jgi:two-component system, NarL family, invasion response regulator UvrY
MNSRIQVALADDHALLRNGLSGLVKSLGYDVMFECNNGKELVERLKVEQPDIILMDINMPEMDGFDATLWVKKNFPLVNVLALSMYDDENAIIRMLRNGARGYILKDSDPQELRQAIDSIMAKGFHYSDIVTGRLIHTIQQLDDDENHMKGMLKLTEREIEFLKLAATEMTYKEIASQMHLSPRTIDGYRDDLFLKLNVRSRVGLVLYAIKQGIVQLN